MSKTDRPPAHERWAELRFSVVGPLLSSPPQRGDLYGELERLAEKLWNHPVTGEPTRFGISTIERWYHQARRADVDPVGALRPKLRADQGRHSAISSTLAEYIRLQHSEHPSWSYKLHRDNLKVLVEAGKRPNPLPSYSTIRRFMKARGLTKQRRRQRNTPGAERARNRLEKREVRSYEVEHVGALWHLDFHEGSRQVLTSAGEWEKPHLLGILDDRSRLACHLQWYLAERAENLVHGLSQAILKRGQPRSLMTDNGSAMTAGETTQGLKRLGIVHQLTLPYSPYQNAKQESFWNGIERRLLAMLEGVEDLTLALLNQATQAWVEMEYNQHLHSEIQQTPIDRFLQGPDVLRPSPSTAQLRLAFTARAQRSQRCSDGTVSIAGRRFEVPSRYRTLRRLALRFAVWDLTHVYLIDDRMDQVLARLYPLDKAKNADGRRRTLSRVDPCELETVQTGSGMAPLLERLMADYAATGLPPAYLPKDESQPVVSDDNTINDNNQEAH